MLAPGPAKKVTIYLNEDTIAGDTYLSDAILALLIRRGVAGATVIRPAAGFGSHHKLHTGAGGIEIDLEMPVRIEFIETEANFRAILPLVGELVADGLIEAHDTMVLKSAEAPKNPSGVGGRA